MNIADLTLKDLTYVVAIAQHGSFSVAAQACSVSQPALSKQLKHIEAALGLPLFERDKRRVFLTEAGKAFVTQAIVVLDEAKKLLLVPAQHQGVLSGVFRMGAIASVCPYLLPRFVGELKTDFPDLKLIVKEGLTEPLVRELQQGKLDAVIAAPTFSDEMLSHVPLFFEPFLLATRKERETRKPSEVDVSDIDPGKLLLLEDGHCLKDQTVELCAFREQDSALNFRATSLETLLHMTAGGLGIAVIPMLAKPSQTKLSGKLDFSGFRDKTIGRTIALYYRKSYPAPANLKVLAAFIQARLPKGVIPLKK